MTALAVGVAWCPTALADTPGSPATGTIQAVHGSDLVDGETFTIPDSSGNGPTTFEFDTAASGVAAGNVAVPFSSGTLATEMKTRIINAINNVGASLDVAASSGGTTLVTLVKDNVGGTGNVLLTETVNDPVFTVSGMFGGTDPNTAPVLAAIGAKSVTVGAQLQFTLSATDAEAHQTLTYSASNLPAGASFDPATRVFSWTPVSTQAGTHSGIRFQVSDGRESDFEDITIAVATAPQPSQVVTQATGQRSAALEKCLKKKTRKARKKCAKRARLLPL